MNEHNIYELVGLKEDPFRISPDPKYFYYTKDHEEALQRLYLSIEEKSGLNVIYGDYGTGKTTMAEILQERYSQREDFLLAKISSPKAKSEFQFYQLILEAFNIQHAKRSTLGYRSALESFAFEKSVAEDRTLMVIIDEGEALTPLYIDILRTFLNFETPDQKFLQLVIFGQLELLPKVRKRRNFVDRINLSYVLNPLNQEETRKLIDYRLKVAGWNGEPLFTEDAYQRVYEYAKGFPRQTTKLCSASLKNALIDGSFLVDEQIMRKYGELEVKLYGQREIREV
jgi:general secretion pathway protein A